VAERSGIPSSSLVCEGFLGQGATTAAGVGFPDLPLARLPGHVDVQSRDELRHNVLSVTVDAVVHNLTGPLRSNACTFVSNGMHGYPTTKRIRLPGDWQARREAAARRL
jgi:hypothetical protein